MTTALLAGVIISSSGTASPASRSTRAKCAGARFVPLVNTTYGTPRSRTHSSIATAPGSGRRPWFTRSPRTSVPSMSKMNPRASRRRSRTASVTPSVTPSVTLPAPHAQPEPRLVHRQLRRRPPPGQFPQQPQHRLQVRVVVRDGRRGGDHPVHLAARHPEPQQQLLVARPLTEPV